MRAQSLVILLTYLLSACAPVKDEENLATASTSCDEGSALIGVYDSYLQVLCGCAEGVGTLATSGNKFTCTVPQNTEVLFRYENTKVAHQMISDGEPSFPSSPVYDPEEEEPFEAHGFYLYQSGTYKFKDAFNHTLFGEIVIN